VPNWQKSIIKWCNLTIRLSMDRTIWDYKIWIYETFTLILASEDKHQESRNTWMLISTKKQKWTIFNNSFKNIDPIILLKEERISNKGNQLAYSSRIHFINSSWCKNCRNSLIQCNRWRSMWLPVCHPRSIQRVGQNRHLWKRKTQHEEQNRI